MTDGLGRAFAHRELQTVKHFGVRRVLPALLWAGRTATPSRRHVFLIGYPPSEGNAVEAARALHSAYPGRIIWAQAPDRSYLDALGIPDDGRIRLVRKSSLTALWHYVTAQAVFFTHGVYGEPPTSRRKPIINMWHGGGLKPTKERFFSERRLPGLAASYVVGGTRLWGEYCASVSGLNADHVLFSGYPRFDQMSRPCTPTQLRQLGISPDRPFVFWMPSYRSARASGTMRAFHDSTADDVDRTLAQRISRGVRVLAERGVQTVVKPHPLDAVARQVEGAIFVDNVRLDDICLPLYTLLGAASGLITDVSSVMTDFLKLDRPIAFYFPDIAEYQARRGIYPPDALNWLPGPLLEEDADFARLAEDVLTGGTLTAQARRLTMDRAGILDFDSSAMQMLRLLAHKDSSAFARSLRFGLDSATSETPSKRI